MGALIVFPDVEGLLVAALNAAFADRMPDVRWGTKVPATRPDRFGRVMRVGGPRESLISENATVVLEGWAKRESDAVAILNLGRAVVFGLDGQLFGASEPGGPANLPDPTTDQIRYTSTLAVRARATVTA